MPTVPIPQGAQLVPLGQAQGSMAIPQGATLQPLDQSAQTQQPPKQSLLQRMGLVPGNDAVQNPPQLGPGQQAGPTYGGDYGSVMSGIAADSAKGLGSLYLQEGPQKAYQGAKDIGSGQYSRGAHEIISGGLNTVGPLVPEAAAAKPLMALRALAGGYVGSKLLGAGANALGATPDQETLAGDVGGLAGGFSAGSGLTRALFETPIKELAARSGTADTIIDLLEKGPRKVLADTLRSKFQSSLKTADAKPATAPQLGDAPAASASPLDRPVVQAAAPQAPAPAPESAPVQSPLPAGAYGKTAGKSSLKSNQRQLASPSGASSPNPTPPVTEGPHPPEIMRILNKPGELSDADMATVQNYFAKQKFANLLGGASRPAPTFSLADMLKSAVGQ